MTSYHPSDFSLSRLLNTLALAGLCIVLLFAFAWQFLYNELPCPLCLLQRAAFALTGVGLLLNIRFGPSPLHYGITILSALGGVMAAGRQTLLHIAPGDMGYGAPFLGMHFYTWALVLFVLIIAYCGVMLTLERATVQQAFTRQPHLAARLVMWVFFIAVAANAISTTLECGFGACPDDPVSYLWLPKS